jgi:hypothetical protein
VPTASTNDFTISVTGCATSTVQSTQFFTHCATRHSGELTGALLRVVGANDVNTVIIIIINISNNNNTNTTELYPNPVTHRSIDPGINR